MERMTSGPYWAPDTGLNSLNALNPLIFTRIPVGLKLTSPLYWWRHWDLKKPSNLTTITFYKQSWDLNTVLLNIKACPLNHYTNQKTTQVDKVTSFCSPWTFTYAEISPPHPTPGIHMATWHIRKIFTEVKQQLSSTILLHLWNRRRAGILARTAVSGHAECALYKSRGSHSQSSIWQAPAGLAQYGSPALAAINVVCDSSPTTSQWLDRRHLTKKGQSDACCVHTEQKHKAASPVGQLKRQKTWGGGGLAGDLITDCLSRRSQEWRGRGKAHREW